MLSLSFQFLHWISSFLNLLIKISSKLFLQLNTMFVIDFCYITSVKLSSFIHYFIEYLKQKMLLNLQIIFLYQLRSYFPFFCLLISQIFSCWTISVLRMGGGKQYLFVDILNTLLNWIADLLFGDFGNMNARELFHLWPDLCSVISSVSSNTEPSNLHPFCRSSGTKQARKSGASGHSVDSHLTLLPQARYLTPTLPSLVSA